jgi:hypothetical protein
MEAHAHGQIRENPRETKKSFGGGPKTNNDKED